MKLCKALCIIQIIILNTVLTDNTPLKSLKEVIFSQNGLINPVLTPPPHRFPHCSLSARFGFSANRLSIKGTVEAKSWCTAASNQHSYNNTNIQVYFPYRCWKRNSLTAPVQGFGCT